MAQNSWEYISAHGISIYFPKPSNSMEVLLFGNLMGVSLWLLFSFFLSWSSWSRLFFWKKLMMYVVHETNSYIFLPTQHETCNAIRYLLSPIWSHGFVWNSFTWNINFKKLFASVKWVILSKSCFTDVKDIFHPNVYFNSVNLLICLIFQC